MRSAPATFQFVAPAAANKLLARQGGRLCRCANKSIARRRKQRPRAPPPSGNQELVAGIATVEPPARQAAGRVETSRVKLSRAGQTNLSSASARLSLRLSVGPPAGSERRATVSGCELRPAGFARNCSARNVNEHQRPVAAHSTRRPLAAQSQFDLKLEAVQVVASGRAGGGRTEKSARETRRRAICNCAPPELPASSSRSALASLAAQVRQIAIASRNTLARPLFTLAAAQRQFKHSQRKQQALRGQPRGSSSFFARRFFAQS